MTDQCALSPLGWRAIWELTRISGSWPAQLETMLERSPGGKQILILGPQRRLVVGARDSEPISADGPDLRLVDLSDQWRFLSVSGPSARALLPRGIEIDLAPAGLPIGTARQTLCAGVPVIVPPVQEQKIDLLIPTSFAPWLADWLAEARSIFLPTTSEAQI